MSAALGNSVGHFRKKRVNVNLYEICKGSLRTGLQFIFSFALVLFSVGLYINLGSDHHKSEIDQ